MTSEECEREKGDSRTWIASRASLRTRTNRRMPTPNVATSGAHRLLGPYAALRLLAENPANLDQNVVWNYGDLVDAGWADASEFMPCARREQTILIATEGSSDVHILKRAIEVLRPEVADFFRFIDVSERHPFSGTGSLVKFAEGLAKIDVQNQVIVLLDNDVGDRCVRSNSTIQAATQYAYVTLARFGRVSKVSRSWS